MFRPDASCVSRIKASPNHGERARESRLDMIVLHYTGMPTAEAALQRLCDADSGVSCHYFVDVDGEITQLVPETRRAWHAGKSCWQGDNDINSRSIGIEIVNPGHEFGYRAFPDRQIAAVIELCRDCGGRLLIPSQNVLAHSDVAPCRKEDPGEKFPWRQLHEAGIGHWVSPVPPTPPVEPDTRQAQEIQEALSEYGYHIEITGIIDDETRSVLRAFQRHFRPQRVDGEFDLSTMKTLQRLLASQPMKAASSSA